MKKIVALGLLLWLLAAGASFADPMIIPAKIRMDSLDAGVLMKGLPLQGREVGESDNGRLRVRWKIRGARYSVIEVIGDDQHDADTIGWQCQQFDKAGDRIEQGKDTFCGQFFIKVLSPLVTNAELIAGYLIDHAKMNTEGQSSVLTYGDLSIETDGRFYFLRRISRM